MDPAPRPSFRYAVNPEWETLPRVNALVGTPLALDYHVPAYTTALTLKSVPRGVATYSTPRSRYRLGPQSVVIFNDGQSYSLDIHAEDRTSTLCLFFEAGFIGDVARAMRDGVERLLDPTGVAPPTFGVCERLHPKTGELAALLEAIAPALTADGMSEAWLEARTFEVARAIVRLDAGDQRAMRRMPGLRPSTRAEVYRRLHWARDFLDASFVSRLTVGELARVACMSPYHFHHLFKRAFGETPMQRVQRLRLDAARTLLVTTDRSVTQVCADVGFESLGSFSALFRRRFGETPRLVRTNAGSKKSRSTAIA